MLQPVSTYESSAKSPPTPVPIARQDSATQETSMSPARTSVRHTAAQTIICNLAARRARWRTPQPCATLAGRIWEAITATDDHGSAPDKGGAHVTGARWMFLRAWRDHRLLRLDEAAPRVGLTNKELWQVETGARELEPALLKRLAVLYACKPDDLLTRDPGPWSLVEVSRPIRDRE
jgi:hypothetical protein